MGPTFGIRAARPAAGTARSCDGGAQPAPHRRHARGHRAHNLAAAMIDTISSRQQLNLDQHNITWRRCSTSTTGRCATSWSAWWQGRRPAEADRFRYHRCLRGDGPARADHFATDMRERLAGSWSATTARGVPVTAEPAGGRRVTVSSARRSSRTSCRHWEHTGAGARRPFGQHRHRGTLPLWPTRWDPLRRFPGHRGGFGADMGAERFFNIKLPRLRARPDAAVVVLTVRALKAHSGKYAWWPANRCPPRADRESDDVAAGAATAQADREHPLHGVSPVVAINAFPRRFRLGARHHPQSRGGRRSCGSAPMSSTAARGRHARRGDQRGRVAPALPVPLPG